MHRTPSGDFEASKQAGYEVSDMNTRLVMYSVAALYFLIVGAALTILIVIRGFDDSRPSLNPTPRSPLAEAGQQVPEKPHLQMNPVADRIQIQADGRHQVESYGVISESEGMERVRIPVQRAMEILAEGKGTYRQEPAPAALEPADPFAEDAL